MRKVKPDSSVSLSLPEFMEEDETTPRSPFWIQTDNHRHWLLNSSVLIIILMVFAILSLVVIIPSLIQFSSNIFKPNLVKRSWDSINLILVLIALLFGFLSRNISNNDGIYESDVPTGAPIMYPDHSISSAIGLRRQRTSVSYPDLRELSPPSKHRLGDPWRFSDDTHLNYYRVSESHRNSFRQRNRREYNSNSGIHDFENSNLYTPSPELISQGKNLYFPPSPAATPVKQKTKRVYRKAAINTGDRITGSGTGKIFSPETESSEQKSGKDERKRSDAKNRRARTSVPVMEPDPDPTLPPPGLPLTVRKRNDGSTQKELFASFNKKKKRQSDRSVDNLASLLTIKPPATTITRVAPFVTEKPGGHLMKPIFNGVDDSSSGGESPMKNIPPPPPPPPPPFKIPDWKFTVEGDFVRLQSTLSSRSVSPDGDEARSPSSDVDTAEAAAVFFPGPDVDAKADSFIKKFRAGLKLERMSKLGPGLVSGPICI